MNVLVIGSGGREHAVIKSFKDSEKVEKIFASPGNAGTQGAAENVVLDLKNHQSVIQFCQIQSISFVFIGPEDSLVDGLCDSLRGSGIHAVGPSKKAAQLEGSKIFAKEFMLKAGVATADSFVVNSVESTLNAASKFTAPYVLKADGLAAGKGVFVCKSLVELETAAQKLFVEKTLGIAGEKALLERHLPGTEVSFIVLTNGKEFQALPVAQDHKRLLNKNMGPNTGGMGTIAPIELPSNLFPQIIQKIIEPTIQQLTKDELVFNGILFVGLMVVDGEPYALEYNVRLGDPETQVLLPLIKNDLAIVFSELAQGRLEKLEFRKRSVICIVNAAPGYPDQPQKDIVLQLPNETSDETAYILHAGTKKNADGRIYSSGGRVLNVVAIADNLPSAKGKALELNAKIIFNGRQYRTDIGDYQFQRKAT